MTDRVKPQAGMSAKWRTYTDGPDGVVISATGNAAHVLGNDGRDYVFTLRQTGQWVMAKWPMRSGPRLMLTPAGREAVRS